MAFEDDLRRAAEAALAADQAAAVAHAALFDFARELGDLTAETRTRNAALPLHVRFVRHPPPHLDAPAGVRVEEAPKERPAGFASVVLEARDCFFAIESLPGIAIVAVTNVPAMESYASAICGIRVASDGRPHLLARTDDDGIAVPAVHTAAGVLQAFVALVADVFLARAAFNPLPTV
jgi:hypothetical protein